MGSRELIDGYLCGALLEIIVLWLDAVLDRSKSCIDEFGLL